MTFEERVRTAIQRLYEIKRMFNEDLMVGHSGGKDSQCILHLANMAGLTYYLVHNPKNSVPLEDTNFLMSHPAIGANRIHIIPTDKMEEFIGLTKVKAQIDGTRIDETSRQDGRSTDVVIDGKTVPRSDMVDYIVENGLYGLTMCYPILDWSEADVYKFLALKAGEISSSYWRT